jgi:hypothetical protein
MMALSTVTWAGEAKTKEGKDEEETNSHIGGVGLLRGGEC